MRRAIITAAFVLVVGSGGVATVAQSDQPVDDPGGAAPCASPVASPRVDPGVVLIASPDATAVAGLGDIVATALASPGVIVPCATPVSTPAS